MRLFSASVTVSTVAALLVLGSYLIPAADSASIVMAMICRDEAVNIKTNIPLWMPLIDYFVFLVDNRTVDDTVGTIHKIIGSDKSRYKVISYEFTGFGQARTLSLKETWNHYSSASHVLIADPDWIPISENINHEELDDPKSEVFRFVAYDRNGQTTRRMDWLLRNREGLQMRYHLHEVLDIGPYMVKYVDFVVREVEKPGSWHTTIGHGNSMSAKRYLFDLDLLQKDLVTYGHDPHTHYYLGITHEAYAQRLLAETGRATDTILEHVAMAERFMKLRIYSEYKDEFVEERWGCMFSLGSLYANYKVLQK